MPLETCPRQPERPTASKNDTASTWNLAMDVTLHPEYRMQTARRRRLVWVYLSDLVREEDGLDLGLQEWKKSVCRGRKRRQRGREVDSVVSKCVEGGRQSSLPSFVNGSCAWDGQEGGRRRRSRVAAIDRRMMARSARGDGDPGRVDGGVARWSGRNEEDVGSRRCEREGDDRRRGGCGRVRGREEEEAKGTDGPFKRRADPSEQQKKEERRGLGERPWAGERRGRASEGKKGVQLFWKGAGGTFGAVGESERESQRESQGGRKAARSAAGTTCPFPALGGGSIPDAERPKGTGRDGTAGWGKRREERREAGDSRWRDG